MAGQLFTVIAPILITAGLGYGWARTGQPYDTRLIARLISFIGAPALIVSTLLRLEVTEQALGEIALAALLAIVSFGAIGALTLRLARLPHHTYLAPLMFANAGNMGLPLCLFAFGEPGLALAIGYFSVSATLQLTFGAWLYSGASAPWAALRTPIPYAVALAVGLMIAGATLPAWLFNSIHLIGELTIPLMLFTLGVSLARMKVRNLRRSVALAALRLAMGLGVGVGIATALGLAGIARGVVIVEAAMPVAVFNYLLSQYYERSPDEVASLVVMSTAFGFVLLPLILLIAM